VADTVSNFDVTCPCCGALMKVDIATRAVISHTAPVKPRMFNDMEEAARAMKEQDSRRESIFRQSVEAQKHASDLLEKKFQEAVKKAKESPDTGKPIRDFDLD
jgi:molecular chaperone DnaK (HSP70)